MNPGENLLFKLSSPEDLRKLEPTDLIRVSSELRQFIIDEVSTNPANPDKEILMLFRMFLRIGVHCPALHIPLHLVAIVIPEKGLDEIHEAIHMICRTEHGFRHLLVQHR